MSKYDNCVNEQIDAPVIMLILSDGDKYGETSTDKALEMANESGMDLVQVGIEVSNNIPICKLMDYGKVKYNRQKKQKSQKKQKVKEIRFGINIADHDIKVKNNKVIKLLNKNNIVRYVLELRGREISYLDLAKEKVKNNIIEFENIAKVGDIEVSKSKSVCRISCVLKPFV